MNKRPQAEDRTEWVFYDGTCGLCHLTVRFLLARDRDGEMFRYAPLDSDAFRSRVPDKQRESLPDSVVVMLRDGTLLSRSTGVLHAARRLGGPWRVLAGAALAVPRPVRDWTYDRIAAVRHRLFARPREVCPIVPAAQRQRFELDD